ncbi:MAG: FAD-dependent thymidylate synthase, partial [Clostridiales bacterium]|nr:FAD-dependent thymidylate synthase [Clostridiales bacterium]
MSNRTAAVSPVVTLLSHTPEPEKVVALAAKLCYSDADVTELRRGVSETDTAKFIAMLIRLGHLSTIEHASFTFSIEGVSRALLAQITRHRIASFSVKSQRYVGADKSFRYVMPPAVAALGQAAADRFHAQMEQMRAWYLEWQ